MHFRIHCKKLHKQYYNSFHHFLILQKIHTTIWTYNSLQKSMFLYIIENMNKKITESHVLLKWKLKQQIKFMIYQNKICGFLLQSPYSFPYFSQKNLSTNPPFPKSSPFWAIPSHIIMIQNQQEFKIQNYNDLWIVPILNTLFIQIR